MEKLDLKGKLRGFISDSKQKLLSPQGGEVDSLQATLSLAPLGCLADRTQWSDSDREVSQLASNPIHETEVLALLDEKYYEEDWDSSTFWLESLGEDVSNIETIDGARKDLMKQLTTVSRRVFSLILSKQSDCTKQLDNIFQVESQLSEGLSTCRVARSGLGRAQRQFVESSLGILANVRRRQQTVLLLEQLEKIQKLSKALEKAELFTSNEDWPGAISLLLDCQRLCMKYQQFTAISQLSNKLSDHLVITEEMMDSALARQCTDFQSNIYTKLQDAYTMLGKSQIATDQILMHFTTATHNTSWQVVYGHVCLMQELPRPPPYQELCNLVQSESFLPCLTDLLRSLWGILLSYYQLYTWHLARWDQEEEAGESLTLQYNRNKLESGLHRIWLDVQSKVKQFVLGSDLSQFSIDSFLHFLDLLHRLITVGQEFLSISQEKEGSRSGSSLLQDSLVQQCLNYFSSYHSSRLEELATHLDNESWSLIPVKQNFSLNLLAEFSHMNNFKSPSKSQGNNSVFRKFSLTGTPFDSFCYQNLEEDILQGMNNSSVVDSDSDDDLSEEQKLQLMEENCDQANTGLTSLSKPKAPVRTGPSRAPASGVTVSNTAIMVLRLIGRYSHMMTVLTPIAKEVWTGICQLFQYYLYTVHLFFSRDTGDSGQSHHLYTGQLTNLISYIHSTVIIHEVRDPEQVSRLVGCVREASLSSAVTLDREQSLYGLPARLVAMESVMFLASQILSLQGHYKQMLQGDLEVGAFFDNCVDVCVDLRTPVYHGAIRSLLNREVVLHQMSRVSWDLKDVVSQHSEYVDHLLIQLQNFSSELTKLSYEIPIPAGLLDRLWETASLVCSHLFVDGFSSAKKCTNEGRALMQLDYRQFAIKLEKLSNLKPVPHQQFVSNYIKAYYIPETELGQWVQEHPEYSSQQLRALVTAVSYNNNKTKQKLNSLINDLSDRIRR